MTIRTSAIFSLKKYLYCLLICSSTCVWGQDIPGPEISCLDVVTNGDVDIYWSKPDSMPPTFSHYEIYFSITNVNFVTFLTINDFDQEQFFHNVAVADNGPVYYFMRLALTTGEYSANSDTVSTMFINLNGENSIDAIADMTWNSFYSDAVLESIEGTYFIERNYNLNWDLAGNTNVGQEFYSEPVEICHGDQDSVLISYRVALPHASGCISHSAIDSGKFRDVNPPSIPQIETVSVDTASNNAVICWYPSPEGDTQGYRIQEMVFMGIDTNYFTLGQTNEPNILSFTYNSSNAANEVEYFVVIPFDSCLHSGNVIGNTNGNINSSFAHHTIYSDLELDRCARTVTVSWNPYDTWPEGVMHYEIYASENNSPYELLGTRGPNGTKFLTSALNINSNYCFFVKAISNGSEKNSFSNVACIDINYPERPDFAYLSRVSMLDEKTVELTAFYDTGTDLKYVFEKFDDFGGDFFTIGQVNYHPTMNDEVTFVHSLNSPISSAVNFRISLIDSCNVEYVNSNVSRNIFLTALPDSYSGKTNLFWNKYSGWDGDVLEYRLYRQRKGEAPVTPIAIFPPWKVSYEDDVNAFIDEQGEFCYYLEAVESVNSYNFFKTSYSHEACATLEPIFWVPNAMVYGGLNNIFKPVGGFLEVENYSLVIYNRWGQQIFETADFDMGWDGTFAGNPVQEGVYFYYIRYQGGDGQVFEKRGDLYLLNAE